MTKSDNVTKCITIRRDQDKWVKKLSINLSRFVKKKIDDEIMSLKTKKKIYYFIIENPNISIQELSLLASMAIDSVKIILTQLEKEGAIVSEDKVVNGKVKQCIRAVRWDEMVDWSVPDGIEDEGER